MDKNSKNMNYNFNNISNIKDTINNYGSSSECLDNKSSLKKILFLMSLKKRKEKIFKNYSKQTKSNIILPFLFLKISIKFIYNNLLLTLLKNKSFLI